MSPSLAKCNDTSPRVARQKFAKARRISSSLHTPSVLLHQFVPKRNNTPGRSRQGHAARDTTSHGKKSDERALSRCRRRSSKEENAAKFHHASTHDGGVWRSDCCFCCPAVTSICSIDGHVAHGKGDKYSSCVELQGSVRDFCLGRSWVCPGRRRNCYPCWENVDDLRSWNRS